MCVCVCVRRRVCSVFGPSDELSWALQAHFCHSISSELHICLEKTKKCVFIAATYQKTYLKSWTLLDLTRQDRFLMSPYLLQTDSQLVPLAIFSVLYSTVVLSKSSVSSSVQENWYFTITHSRAKHKSHIDNMSIKRINGCMQILSRHLTIVQTFVIASASLM